MPVVRENLEKNGKVELSAAIVASWARYDEAIDELGKPIEVVDSLKEELVSIAKTQRSNPKAFIENKKLFGDIANEPRFMTPYLSALASLHEVGAQETLKGILK